MENQLAAVTYESLSGISITLDEKTVIDYCARGDGTITPQEVALFLRTCQAKRLDPLEAGEIFLIKFGSAPAQMVVGKQAYNRRADRNPEYRGKTSGIVVFRDGQVIQKEGCAVYAELKEKLIGGWCRVKRHRAGAPCEEEVYREVSLSEYSTGKANWTSKPATMIEKVAVSQCLREAFPNEYEGLYSEDEMVASGAIPVDYMDCKDVSASADMAEDDDPIITQEQRKELFNMAKKTFGDKANELLGSIIGELGYTSTTAMLVSAWEVAKAMVENWNDAPPEDEAEG